MSSKNFSLSPLNTADDYIGTESCMDLRNDIDDTNVCKTNSLINSSGNSTSKKKNKVTREFPPPIPLLLSNSHVSWALARYYTTDGRLILKEEKVKQHCEYLRASRLNGRLTLQFVDEDEEDGVLADDDEDDEKESDNNNNNNEAYDKTNVGKVSIENNECGETNSLNCNVAKSSPSCILHQQFMVN